MLPAIALAVGVALQLETGAVRYASGGDDLYVDQKMPNNMRMTAAAFGAAVRGNVGNAELSVGWRSLGGESINAQILLPDNMYWDCGGGGAPKGYHATKTQCAAPNQWWHSDGSVSQTFAELGYAFNAGKAFQIVPSVGVGRTYMTWHMNEYALTGKAAGTLSYAYHGVNETLAQPFLGVTLRAHSVGVGLFVLGTASQSFGYAITPGEGSYATYLRVTYTIGSL